MRTNNNKMFYAHPYVAYGDHKVKDFTRMARILVRVRDNDYYSADYYVEDSETPYTLAKDFYNDPNLFWVFLNLNDMIDPWHDWPMDYNTLVEYTRYKYDLRPDREEHKRDVVDTLFWGGRSSDLWFTMDELSTAHLNVDWANTPEEFLANADIMSHIDYESYLNDQKRYIRIIRPERISEIVDEYRKEIK